MARIRSRNTSPEIALRRQVHALGLRFRLHRRDLPGTPDLVLPKFKVAVFVHGCFWHRHAGCKLASTPKSNQEFWNKKFERNLARDLLDVSALTERGWLVLVFWECQIKRDVADCAMAVKTACEAAANRQTFS